MRAIFDFSFNKPALPVVGTNFGGTGPYANYFYLGSVPNTLGKEVEVINTSGAQIALILDDGTAATGAAPQNASVFSLAGGSGVGSQGTIWNSPIFKGRIQIYAPTSTAQIMVRIAG